MTIIINIVMSQQYRLCGIGLPIDHKCYTNLTLHEKIDMDNKLIT